MSKGTLFEGSFHFSLIQTINPTVKIKSMITLGVLTELKLESRCLVLNGPPYKDKYHPNQDHETRGISNSPGDFAGSGGTTGWLSSFSSFCFTSSASVRLSVGVCASGNTQKS